MTAITTKSRQMRLDNCALNTPKRVQIAGNLRENACKDREAATPADAANAGLENNGKIRQIHPNTKLLGKYRFIPYTHLALHSFDLIQCYCIRAATPGRSLPSIHSKNAPPAVEI